MYREKGGGFVVWLARKIGAEKKAQEEEAVSAYWLAISLSFSWLDWRIDVNSANTIN